MLYSTIIVLIFIIFIAIVFMYELSSHSLILGGKQLKTSPHIIVDTLNLTYLLNGKVTPETIIKTIDDTSPIIRKSYAGRIIYVLKGKDSVTSAIDDDEFSRVLKDAANRNKVYISSVAQYVEPPSTSIKKSYEHSAKGRDDFYMILLANKYKCPLLTNDRLKDFPKFRETIQPFHVYEYTYWTNKVERVFIRPEAWVNIRRPWLRRWEDISL